MIIAKRYYEITGAIFAGVITCLVGMFVAVSLLYSSMFHEADKMLAEIDGLNQGFYQVVQALQPYANASTCSDDVLKEMRRQTFLNDFARDIGFLIEGRLLCSSGLGVLEETRLLSNPDYVTITGVEIWTDRPVLILDGGTALIAKLGNINVVFNIEREIRVDNRFGWEVVYHSPEGIQHVAGSENVYSYDHTDKQLQNIHPSWLTQKIHKCHKTMHYCVAVDANNADYFYQKHVYWSIIFVSVLGGTLGFILSGRFIDYKRSLKTRVLKGFHTNAFFNTYQPFVDLQSGEVTGCEVLSRFRDQYGEVYPDQFIPIIVNENLTWKFTMRVVEIVTRELKGISNDKFKVSINIFPADLLSGEAIELVNDKQLLNTFSEVCLEIIENELIENENAIRVIEKLNDAGFQIALDDFGTGYSNFKQLSTLPIDYLKIDRSLIDSIEEESIKSHLISHIVSIAKQLGMELIAEGIEKRIQAKLLMEKGVLIGQGWYYSRAIEGQELHNFVKSLPKFKQSA